MIILLCDIDLEILYRRIYYLAKADGVNLSDIYEMFLYEFDIFESLYIEELKKKNEQSEG